MEKLPEESECEKFTELQIIDYINEVIKRLDDNKNRLDLEVIEDLLNRIICAYFIWHNQADKIAQIFIEEKLLDIFYFYLNYFLNNFKLEDVKLDFLLKSLINFSYESLAFAHEIYCSDILKIIIDECIKNRTITDETKEFVRCCVLIISNVARDLGNQIEYKVSELKESLIEFIKLENEEKLAVQSMLTLSYIIKDDETHLLVEGSNTVKTILALINKTIKFNKRKGNYSIPELMLGLFRISANNEIKQTIDKNGGIPILIDIINSNVENEIELTLGTIYNLCFNEEIKQKLIYEFEIEKLIKPFENHEKIEIKKVFDGIVWEIRGKNETVKKRKKNESYKAEFDVFVSYAHENKTTVMGIFNELKNQNIRIWIDKEQMSGSILEAMARGIENSRLFIIGISPYYEKSPNCRSEAEYAYQCQKTIIPMILQCRFKPEGWLGFIRGMKMYYEISERRNTEEVLKGLVQTIKMEIEENVNEISLEHFKQDFDQHSSGITITGKPINEVIKNMSAAEVSSWLDEAKLSYLKKRLNELDGKLLLVILDIRSKSPGYFNKTLKNEFGMKFMDVLKFHNALNNLESV